MIDEANAHLKAKVRFEMTVEQARFIALVLGNMSSKQAKALAEDGGRLIVETFNLFHPHYPNAVQADVTT